MKTILVLSKGSESSSTRYRALQYRPLFEQHGFALQHQTLAGGVTHYLSALRAARNADVVLVLRKTLPWPLLRLLRCAARRLVFDYDDAIFCNTDGSFSATRRARFAAMVQASDGVLAGNAFLASHAVQCGASATLIPTALDPARYRVTADKPLQTLDLVWIGSRSTRKYLAEAMPALADAAAQLGQLRLKIIADFDLPGQGIATLPVAWREETEAQELASAHIGIAPMRDDDWSRGKCALKVLQYMAAGLPVISSASGANAEIVRDGDNGLLAATPQDWATGIARLGADADLRERMGASGRALVEADYSIESVFSRLLGAIEATMAASPARLLKR
jgi:glycosyltransferase involved in cell wall biosynthesis